ncbi:hypothetical protein Bca52824_074416 [Brassica carinata]|uniref:Uncharacterized protein n=1 Tax=Brassica carinata TaxID=52824 RepID=A0A8X7TUR4_BRACI|nr:hypothetical protein Bca52824_074416 [Brassica carinata]
MNRLQHFVDENDNLINLVTKLPDQLRHNNIQRDKTLQSQIHSLKAEIEDFQSEASFFATTASEAAEGLLEIREEYEEEDSSATVLQPSGFNPGGEGEAGEGEVEVEENEFARIMSKLNELEMQEELEGEDGDDYKGEDQDSSGESVEESEHVMVFDLRDKSSHNRIGDEESAAKQESTISVLEKVSVWP